jgi:pimeloyl-ACP methyl ester carboxylesterase
MKRKMLLSVLVFALLLTSCGRPAASPTPTEVVPEPTATIEPTPKPTPTTKPTQEPTPTKGGIITGEAVVESIEILLLESFPIQVHVVARGNLHDSCTEIGEITKQRDGDTFRVTITTSRPADAMCAQVLVPFEEVISLDVVGLPAGVYTVNVNGVTDTFEFTVDNAMVQPPVQPRKEFVPTFEEAPCPFDLPEGAPVECGFVVVPEDHNDPAGPTIRLAIVIVKDQSDDHQPDPVILLSGGPGEKEVASAPAIAQLLAPVYPNRDFIIFDQRGAGLSEPALECPEWVQAAFDLLDEPDPDVVLQTLFDALMACRDRLVSEGHNLAAYNTVQNAADVNAIRIALGYDQINLWGGSYGSLLAQATVRDHPEGIRSAAINSVLPLEKSLFVEASTTTSNAVMRLLDACAADEACNSAYPDLQDVLFEVIDQLNAEPVPITVTNPLDGQSYDEILTGDTVLGNLVLFLYFTRIIPVLPQAIHDVYDGNYELMTQLSSTRLSLFEALSRGMMFSVMCTEDLVGRTPEDLLNVMAALPRQLAGSTDPELEIEYGIFGICENWPVEEAGPWVKEPLVSDIPTLVLTGEFDPVTPPEYGQLVASHLSNSTFFELPGIGHDILVASECARSIIGDFIADPTQPPDASCIAEMPGVAFDLPREAEEVVLEPVTWEDSGISGLVPAGWTDELLPRNYRRGLTALDPTTLVQDAVPMTADELFGLLAMQLGLDPELESVASAESDSLVWDLYSFEYQSYRGDLALAEDDDKAYFVLLISPSDERDALYETVFLSVVDALAPLK